MPDGADARDFVAFYDEFMPQVYRYVQYRVADAATAEDLTASIFEKALRAWHSRRKQDSAGPWVLRIARNAVVSHYRRRGRCREVPLENDSDGLELMGAGPGPEKSVLDAERWAQIRQGLHTLSRREQDIIALKFGSGLTNRAIAPMVGLTENHVAVVLHRAMHKLRAYLEG